MMFKKPILVLNSAEIFIILRLFLVLKVLALGILENNIKFNINS